jgi:hypothetical protein
MAKQLLDALTYAKITALGVAAITLHWAARSWAGEIGVELRKLADEMSERAKRLREGYFNRD